MSWAPYVNAVITATSYATAPDVELTFEPNEINFNNTSSHDGNTIFVSFDGTTDHMELIRLTAWQTFKAITRQKKIWFRRGTYVAGTASVARSANSYV